MCSAIPVLVFWVDITVAVWYSYNARRTAGRSAIVAPWYGKAEARVVKPHTKDGFGGNAIMTPSTAFADTIHNQSAVPENHEDVDLNVLFKSRRTLNG